ncbi:MAG: hypothetical protein JWO32_229 [Bacteroidetes bacterium]|nr:hypothetical protein [Bacteroidota bacterium]
MKKITLLAATMLCCLQVNAQTKIKDGAFGQNANYSDTIGSSTGLGGKLEAMWNNPNYPNFNKMQESNFKTMRYHGIAYENRCLLDGNINTPGSNIFLTAVDLVRKAKMIYANGGFPMLGLPYNPNNIPNINVAASAIASVVAAVNGSLVAQGHSPVTKWIYSNEPEGNIHNWNDTLAAQKIYNLTRAYHDSVVAHWNYPAWDTVRFIGPELESYDNYNHSTGSGTANKKINRLVDQLMGRYTPYGNFSILPYIDVFTIHYYPFANQATYSTTTNGGNFAPAKRKSVIDALQNQFPPATTGYSFEPLSKQLDTLNNRLAAYNSQNNKKITVAITEANLCYANDVNGTSGVTEAQDLTKSGTSANSFIAGQFWAELMCIGMLKNTDINFWSAIEGTSTDNYATDIGFLSKQTLGAKKHTYNHFKLIADNFRGYIYKGSYNHNGVSPASSYSVNNNGIKGFAAVQPAGVKVLLMNQNDNPYPYRINFNNSGGTTTGTVSMNFSAISTHTVFPASTFTHVTYMDTIMLPARSTVMLTFDCHGDFFSRYTYKESDSTYHLKQIGTVLLNPEIIACQRGISGTLTANTTYSFDTVYVDSDITLR